MLLLHSIYLAYILFTYYTGSLTPKRRHVITILAPIWTGSVVNAIRGIARQVSISTKGQFIYDPSRKQQHKTRSQQRSDINFSLLSQTSITTPTPYTPPSDLVYLCLNVLMEKCFNQREKEATNKHVQETITSGELTYNYINF